MTTTSQADNEFRPATASELARFVRANADGPRRPLTAVGGRTALHFGFERPESSVLLDLTSLDSIVDYPVEDMTVTVEAGVRFERLAEVLRANNQRVPVDVAQPHRATVGGAVATNTSGPRRFAHGTWRDYVLGVSAVDGSGRVFKAGGRVVKNVAGYDLGKLLVGSLGTLAVLTQVTLRLKPLPEQDAFVWFVFERFEQADRALELLVTSATRPVALELLNGRAAASVVSEARLDLPTDGVVLAVGFEGLSEECRWQVQKVREELDHCRPKSVQVVTEKATAALWTVLTEYATFSDDPASFQASLRPSATVRFAEQASQLGVAVQAHAGNGVVVGHLPEETVRPEDAERILRPLRKQAEAGSGRLIVLQCDPRWKRRLPVWGPPSPSWTLMRKLKQTFDPYNVLNPGVFVDQPVNQDGVPCSAAES